MLILSPSAVPQKIDPFLLTGSFRLTKQQVKSLEESLESLLPDEYSVICSQTKPSLFIGKSVRQDWVSPIYEYSQHINTSMLTSTHGIDFEDAKIISVYSKDKEDLVLLWTEKPKYLILDTGIGYISLIKDCSYQDEVILNAFPKEDNRTLLLKTVLKDLLVDIDATEVAIEMAGFVANMLYASGSVVQSVYDKPKIVLSGVRLEDFEALDEVGIFGDYNKEEMTIVFDLSHLTKKGYGPHQAAEFSTMVTACLDGKIDLAKSLMRHFVKMGEKLVHNIQD